MADLIRQQVVSVIEEAPLARLDYFDIVDNETLEPVEKLAQPALAALAVHFSSTRLIDNTVLDGPGASASR